MKIYYLLLLLLAEFIFIEGNHLRKSKLKTKNKSKKLKKQIVSTFYAGPSNKSKNKFIQKFFNFYKVQIGSFDNNDNNAKQATTSGLAGQGALIPVNHPIFNVKNNLYL